MKPRTRRAVLGLIAAIGLVNQPAAGKRRKKRLKRKKRSACVTPVPPPLPPSPLPTSAIVSGSALGVSNGFTLLAGLYKATAVISASDPPGEFAATLLGPSGWSADVFTFTPANPGTSTREAAVTLPVDGGYLWDVWSADGKWTLILTRA